MVLSENLLDIFMVVLLTKKGMTQTELIYSHKNKMQNTFPMPLTINTWHFKSWYAL